MSDILNLSKSVEQLLRGNDSQAAQFVDIFIDAINGNANEVRALPDPGRIGVTLYMAVSKGLVKDSDVRFTILVLTFWSLWKSRRHNPDNYEVRVSLDALLFAHSSMFESFYAKGQETLALDDSTKAKKRQLLHTLLEECVLEESPEYNSYGDVAFSYLDPRILRA